MEETESHTNNNSTNKKYTWMQYRVIIVLSLCNFIASAVYSIQSPFYPPEAEKKNVTSTEYGIVFGIYELVIFFSCPFVPFVTQKLGAFTTFHTGIYTVVTSVVLFGFLDRINNHICFVGLSIFLRIFEAMGASLVVITNYTFGPKLFPESVATVLAILETMFAFGQAAGPPIGGVFYQLGGFTLPFVVLGGTLGLLTICTLPTLPRVKNKDNTNTNSSTPNKGFGFLALLKIPFVQLYVFNQTSTAISVGFLTATLEPHLRQFDLTPIQTGAMYLIYGGVYAISSPPWGYISDHISNPKYIPIVGSVCMFVGFMFIGPVPFLNVPTSIGLVAGSLVLIGLGLGAIYVSGFLLILNGAKNSEDFEESSSAFVSSLWLSAITFGSFIGPILGGALYQQFGFQYETLFVEGLFIINIFALLIGTICSKSTRRIENNNLTNRLRTYTEQGFYSSLPKYNRRISYNYDKNTKLISQSVQIVVKTKVNDRDNDKDPLLPKEHQKVDRDTRKKYNSM